MTQDQEPLSQSEQLLAILEQLSEWQQTILRGTFYASESGAAGVMALPLILQDWLEDCAATNCLDDATIQVLREICIELSKMAEKFISEAGRGELPKLAEFDEFMNVYNDLVDRLQRIESDAEAGNSTDEQTGFRTLELFEKDFKREQDRFSRSDKPFCLSVVKIDAFEDIKQAGEMAKKQAILGATKAIQACLRTFDDAYTVNDHTFVLCLKNTSIKGGNAALMRINGQISKDNAMYRVEDEEYPLSVSASIAEVQVSDKAMDLVKRMQKDVESAEHEPGSILHLQEMSALQQYVQDIDR